MIFNNYTNPVLEPKKKREIIKQRTSLDLSWPRFRDGPVRLRRALVVLRRAPARGRAVALGTKAPRTTQEAKGGAAEACCGAIRVRSFCPARPSLVGEVASVGFVSLLLWAYLFRKFR